MRVLLTSCVFAFIATFAGAAEVLTLDELVKQASTESEEIRATELTLQSTEAEITARDFELSPRLTTEIAQVEDRRATFSPGRRALSRFVDLTLVKPFASGTSLSLNTGYEVAEVASVGGNRHIADWELTLSQSLWRNSFGRSTRLRRRADHAELSGRRLDMLLRKQQFLVDLETNYWDLVLLLKETEVRENNLERSAELEKWIKSRIQYSAAEPTDSYQIQALVDAHRLELANTQSRIATLWTRLGQLIPSAKPGAWQPDLNSLEEVRSPDALIAERDPNTAREPTLITALASKARVDQFKALSERVDDNGRPQLDLVVTHGRNGIEPGFDQAWKRTVGPDSTYTKFGVQFSVELDAGLKLARERASLLQAQARELEAKRLERGSTLEWKEVLTRIDSLKASVSIAKQAAASQSKKIQLERKRYKQGRSTAFQMISFEISAAQAELDVYRLLNELRKTESQSRLFVTSQEGESS